MEDFKFKKSFGQNFLKDDNIIKNIVSESNIKSNSLVIETINSSPQLGRFFVSVLLHSQTSVNLNFPFHVSYTLSV